MSGFEPRVADHARLRRSATQGSCRRAAPRLARAGMMPYRRTAQAGRCHRRHVRQRRSRARRDRHGHARRRRPVYAFGHPMYNLGPTEFPMTRAYVYTVLPSLFSSIKLSTTGEIDRHVSPGSRDRDCRPARGRPAMIPVTHDARRRTAARKRTFNFSVVSDQMFTPLMTYAALVNTLTSYERQFGTATYALQRHGEAEGPRRAHLRQYLRGREPPSNAVDVCRRADHRADGQRLRDGGHRAARPDDHLDRAAADRDARARLDRRSAAARRAHECR